MLKKGKDLIFIFKDGKVMCNYLQILLYPGLPRQIWAEKHRYARDAILKRKIPIISLSGSCK